MSLFDSLGNNTPKSQAPSVEQLKRNPSSTLKQAGFNIPGNMTDPTQIINYLLQSGQISNPRLQMAQRILGGVGRTR